MYGAYGVLAALREREITGRGRIVHTSLLASVVGIHSFQGTRYTVANELPTAVGSHHPSICPYGLFQCSDASVQIAVGTEGLWRRFATDFDLDRPRWASNAQRVDDRDAVVDAVNLAFASYTSGEVLERLANIDVPAGKLRNLGEVYAWDQTRSQGLLIDVEHSALGPLTLPGPPLRFDDLNYAGGRRVNSAPPVLDEHAAAIRAWLDGPDDG
jgi:formyl-CoA transferase